MSETHPSGSPGPTEIAGRYEVVQKLGAGAFGTVYKARDKTLGRMLAIKTIRLEGLAAASTDLGELLKRFRQEATAGAALKHPNIVTVYDFGQSGGLTYLAMEYVEGQGLERIIAESGKLPVARAAGLAAQVADALGYAHQHGVIHRDIKPANIMVEAGERVKVTDFGIARVTNSGENLTQTGGLLGTPSYMSPEQARGQKVDGRSDLFSVGCVLYELLSGRKAFSGDTITGILMKIITEEPPPIREAYPLIPDEAVRIVEKALAKSPDARYQTGRELADELLALTQPGYVPTVRQADVPTSPVAGVAPTIATPPTAQGTISSSPTTARGASPDKGATVPVPPTELVTAPPLPVPPPPTPPSTPATAARTRRPQPLPARRKTGGGAGRWVGLAAAAVLVLALLATGTWWTLGRRDSAPTATTDVRASAEAPVPTGVAPPAAAPATDAEGPAPATTEPTPTAPTPAAVPPPAASSAPATATGAGSKVPPRPAATADVQSTGPVVTPSRPVPADPAATNAAPPPPPAGEDFLDRLPEEAPDGRAAGDALAQQYRSGSGSSGTFGATGRYQRRPRIPPHGPTERPAVRALAWILSAQTAHLARAGRYGTLSELVEAGDLPLGGGWTADGFTRRQYRFTVRAARDGFRADAQPLASGRAFYVDDAGYVLVAD